MGGWVLVGVRVGGGVCVCVFTRIINSSAFFLGFAVIFPLTLISRMYLMAGHTLRGKIKLFYTCVELLYC